MLRVPRSTKEEGRNGGGRVGEQGGDRGAKKIKEEFVQLCSSLRLQGVEERLLIQGISKIFKHL